jgi:hypothetical protein
MDEPPHQTAGPLSSTKVVEDSASHSCSCTTTAATYKNRFQPVILIVVFFEMLKYCCPKGSGLNQSWRVGIYDLPSTLGQSRGHRSNLFPSPSSNRLCFSFFSMTRFWQWTPTEATQRRRGTTAVFPYEVKTRRPPPCHWLALESVSSTSALICHKNARMIFVMNVFTDDDNWIKPALHVCM